MGVSTYLRDFCVENLPDSPGTGHILQQSWAWTHSLVRLGCKAAALVLRKYHYHLQVIAQWNADPPLAIYLVAAF